MPARETPKTANNRWPRSFLKRRGDAVTEVSIQATGRWLKLASKATARGILRHKGGPCCMRCPGRGGFRSQCLRAPGQYGRVRAPQQRIAICLPIARADALALVLR